MTLIEQIQFELMNDDEDDSDRLIELYKKADKRGKDLLDTAFICLCGYSLGRMVEKAT